LAGSNGNLALEPGRFYRLPWTLTDNAISWLEPTISCNMSCVGCYRRNLPHGHKPLEQIKHELEVFRRFRRSDGISIAGGEPLIHPNIVDIVRLIADSGLKPIINSNGLALDKSLLHDLKKAGVAGFTFHIDSKQSRPGWEGKSEEELNELRLYYAEMLAREGGIACSFNATVFPDTLESVPNIVAWGQEHIDIVHTLVFIAFRAMQVDRGYDYYVGGRKVDVSSIVYSLSDAEELENLWDIQSVDIVNEIRKKFPDFDPSAYLGGTIKPDTFKWLLTVRMGVPGRIYGYVGRKFVELAQVLHHFLYGTYLAYAKPRALRMAKSYLLFSPLDRGLRRIASAYLRHVARNPLVLFRPVHLQSVMIIQPGDIQPDGRVNMCDGCPDITVWNDQLVWSCRLEELNLFGSFVRAFPRDSGSRGAGENQQVSE